MKKVVIVNSSSVFEYRVDMIYEALKKKGYDVTVLASDYLHIEKKKRKIDKDNYISVKTIPYKKNISFSRIYSHYNFAKKCKKILDKMSFDVLYLIVPPNFQATLAKKYKNNKNIKIVMDIIDLWPESFPSTHTDKFPFTLWQAVRDRSLRYADFIVMECKLYVKKLKKYIKEKDKKVIYWAHKKNDSEITPDFDKLNDKGLRLLYLGSINNIIDIEKIADVIKKLSENNNVFLDIIGGGETKEEFVFKAKAAGAIVTDHGKVYDFKKKQKIMDSCNFGINIMKETVCIGLSMKSIDYLEGGLPLINNLRDDIGNIVKEDNCGVNIYENGWEEKILSHDENVIMKRNARTAFEKYFSPEKFEEAITGVFEEL